MTQRYILTLSCRDVAGIVATVAGFLRDHGGFILQSAQFGDFSTGQFFMRTFFEAGAGAPKAIEFRKRFQDLVATPFNMDWALHDVAKKSRLLIMVSQQSHCLNDLLHRYESGTLPVEIPAIASNHETLQHMAERHGIPFHFLPVTPQTKQQQEQAILKLAESANADLIVLARYMQILSPAMCSALKGRAINIHHSFLPSFKGAKPYHQAYHRGAKIIGATAHYVTENLDEGPIIEQEVTRADHTCLPEDLVAMGQDIECLVLARALKYHIEHRVLLNGNKTVVFK